ncbi:MAG: hypothetical protein P4L49_09850 [Desulfosporosinus sp.]|nr:hypothetical protein [Desulfosporosinus sp.]
MNTANSEVAEDDHKSQKYLGRKGLVVLIAFLSAFIPLSTDLYLPALPGMAEYFKAAPSLINLTIILFFIFNAPGLIPPTSSRDSF